MKVILVLSYIQLADHNINSPNLNVKVYETLLNKYPVRIYHTFGLGNTATKLCIFQLTQ